MRRYFGTDGVRDVANAGLSAELAFAIGLALGDQIAAQEPHRNVLIGRDSRLSGDLLEAAVAAGLMAMGVDVLALGVVPTPAVAWATRHSDACAGVMISASHNPIEDNGIKIFGADGSKLTDQQEESLEAGIDGSHRHRPVGVGVGQRHDATRLRQSYVHQLSALSTARWSGSVIVDCAWGAAAPLARQVLAGSGAHVRLLHGVPDGTRINVKSGSTDLERLQQAVRRQGHGTIGVAFDGDADRALAVDEMGEVVTGDHLIGMFAPWFRTKGWLDGGGVALTVLANGGLRRALAGQGVQVIETQVGDRYLLEGMRQANFALAGEPSGHLLALGFNTTGDGLLTARLLLWLLAESGQSLSALKASFTPFPHLESALRVADKQRVFADPRLTEAVAVQRAALGPLGRVTVRPSGTEPLIRVMVEGQDVAICTRVRDTLLALIAGLNQEVVGQQG
ncbi:MAG: phosphoglucosamine mutase [Sulfobacillus sp.]